MPDFEYPIQHLPANVRFVGAPRPPILADEDVLVVATTGGCDPRELGPLPANARAASLSRYELLLAEGIGVRHQRWVHRHESSRAGQDRAGQDIAERSTLPA